MSAYGTDLLRGLIAQTEQQRAAPDSGDRHQDIHDPAQHGGSTAKQPCHEVKLEDTDQAPVQTADDQQCQKDLIPDVIHVIPSFLRAAFCKSGSTAGSYMAHGDSMCQTAAGYADGKNGIF